MLDCVEPRGTITPADPFDREADAKALYDAVKGLGTLESTITEILTKRTNGQRQDIVEAYSLEYGADLLEVMKSELSGSYLRVVEGLLDEPQLLLAHIIHTNATNTSLLAPSDLALKIFEIIFPLNYVEISCIKEVYHQAFGTELEGDLVSHLYGPWIGILIDITKGSRNENAPVDDASVESDVEYLMENAVDSWMLPNMRIEDLLTKSSLPHLTAVFRKFDDAWTQKTGKSLTDAIKVSNLTAEQKDGYSMIVNMCVDYIRFNAMSLHRAMAGLGTDDDTLITIIVLRAELDLENIKVIFQKLYDKSLRDAVSGDTSGDYRAALLAIIGD
ncbi:annexin A13-like [Diadema antillarum]|uniref:annexin A13-like n=1 Tax=Diadema antillarum TaxID=105358 RepID=UPI003A87C10A